MTDTPSEGQRIERSCVGWIELVPDANDDFLKSISNKVYIVKHVRAKI